MDKRRLEALGTLHRLSRMKAEAELAKLAAVAASRNRLRAALETLRDAEAPLGQPPAPGEAPVPMAPGMLSARLAHRRWIEAQQRRLNQQLALVTADYLRQRPAAARAFGREKVLEQLGEKLRADLKQARDARARDET